jgi:mono/diheme cytochrome c family protein
MLMLVGVGVGVGVGVARAVTPGEMLAALESEARIQSGASAQASPARGEAFFNARRQDWSCASCHTADPRGDGRHIVTGKPIKPMAPAANPERFTDRSRTDKWFRRNCHDVLGRTCSASEQADVVAYLMSLRVSSGVQ